MREVKGTPSTFETEEWRFDFLNMKATALHIGAGTYDMMRGTALYWLFSQHLVLPDCQFVPYLLPKNDRSHSYLKDTDFADVRNCEGNNSFCQKEHKLVALWLRWDGSDQAFKEYTKSLWGIYSPEVSKQIVAIFIFQTNVLLETKYREWRTNKDRGISYRIDEAYSVNFDKMIQFRTENSYRRRYGSFNQEGFFVLTRNQIYSEDLVWLVLEKQPGRLGTL